MIDSFWLNWLNLRDSGEVQLAYTMHKKKYER